MLKKIGQRWRRLFETTNRKSPFRGLSHPRDDGAILFDDSAVERLESRTLLAGVVTATVQGRFLDIRGDNQANDVVVSKQGGVWRVTAGDATTQVTTTGLMDDRIRHVRVRLGEGDDSVRLENAELSGDVRVVDSGGATYFVVIDSVFRSLRLIGKVGDTEVLLEGVGLARGASMACQRGSMMVDVSSSQFGGTVVTRSVGSRDQLRLTTESRIAGNLVRITRGGPSQTVLSDASEVTRLLRIRTDRDQAADVAISDDSSVGRLIGIVPHVLRNLVYSTPNGEALRADVYIPSSSGPHSAVLLIHGGYWRFGSKSNMARQARYLVDRGFAVVAVNYRLAPESMFPAQIYDVKAAVRWMRTNAERFRIAPDRIAAYGYSAGAQLALLLGVTDAGSGLEGDAVELNAPSSRVQAVIAGGAPTDFQDRGDTSDELSYYLGGTPGEVPEVYASASPIYWVSSDDAPTLFYVGAWDFTINQTNLRQMYNALVRAGVASEFLTLDFATHLTAAADTRALTAATTFLRSQLMA